MSGLQRKLPTYFLKRLEAGGIYEDFNVIQRNSRVDHLETYISDLVSIQEICTVLRPQM
jgi:hypothetical protein